MLLAISLKSFWIIAILDHAVTLQQSPLRMGMFILPKSLALAMFWAGLERVVTVYTVTMTRMLYPEMSLRCTWDKRSALPASWDSKCLTGTSETLGRLSTCSYKFLWFACWTKRAAIAPIDEIVTI